MHSFVSLDFELANPSYASICSIGVARCADSVIQAPRHWYVRPAAPYDYVHPTNRAITGISASDLAAARGFVHHGQNLLCNIGNGVIVGHGVYSADLPMFSQSWGFVGLGDMPAVRYLDTEKLARLVVPGLAKYNLDVLCQHVLGRTMVGHHRADIDAATTAELAIALLNAGGLSVDEVAQVKPAHTPKRPKPPSLIPGCVTIRPAPRIA